MVKLKNTYIYLGPNSVDYIYSEVLRKIPLVKMMQPAPVAPPNMPLYISLMTLRSKTFGLSLT